jgi:protein TonB
LNLGDTAYLAPHPATPAAYLSSSTASRAAMLMLIFAAHVMAVLALGSLGRVVLEIVQPPINVKVLPEQMRAKPTPPSLPVPQLRRPDIVLVEPPRFETLVAVQMVEKPVPPPSVPMKTAAVADAVVEPPRFDLAYLNNPAPSYPVIAKRAREQGKVLLRVQVDAAGQVAGIEIHRSSGFERLDKAALAAVRQWRFVPARSGDRAISGVALVPITFQLEG